MSNINDDDLNEELENSLDEDLESSADESAEVSESSSQGENPEEPPSAFKVALKKVQRFFNTLDGKMELAVKKMIPYVSSKIKNVDKKSDEEKNDKNKGCFYTLIFLFLLPLKPIVASSVYSSSKKEGRFFARTLLACIPAFAILFIAKPGQQFVVTSLIFALGLLLFLWYAFPKVIPRFFFTMAVWAVFFVGFFIFYSTNAPARDFIDPSKTQAYNDGVSLGRMIRFALDSTLSNDIFLVIGVILGVFFLLWNFWPRGKKLDKTDKGAVANRNLKIASLVFLVAYVIFSFVVYNPVF